MTSTLRRLEQMGRIERLDDPDDRRSRRVRVTAEGVRFYDAVLSELLERYALAFSGLDVGAELEGVRRVTGALERSRGVASSREWGIPAPAARAATGDGPRS
jgi:DNA-binding MarR family transcriptional regulator